MKLIRRLPLVCLEQNCHRCRSREFCSESCPYILLHTLDDDHVYGLQEKPRRSGKTTETINTALKIANLGYQVMIVSPNIAMVRYIGDMLAMHGCLDPFKNGIYLTTEHDIFSSNKQDKSWCVLTDELLPRQVDAIMDKFPRSEFVMGRYTERERP